jgi:penicillin-binding protein 2
MKERLLAYIVSALFVLVALGLFYTQIIRYGYFAGLAKNNSIRIIPIDGPRGNIYDKNGAALVTNRLSFDAAVVYGELRDRKALAGLLNKVLGMSDRDIAEALRKAQARPFAPVMIAEDIDKEKAMALEETSYGISGFMIQTRSRRDYLYNDAGSHLFGYLSEITEAELEDLEEYGYRTRDLVGRDGLEKYYDGSLRGSSGGVQIEVDNRGRQKRVLGLKEPVPGSDIYLNIDIALQLASDKFLGAHKGAIVIMDPRDGAVLALASHPAFDPNIFARSGTTGERMKLLKDNVGRPMSNRAISGLYPPGSIFKIVTSAAALETKAISPNTRFTCGGSFLLGRAKFDCWKEGGHGSQNLNQGLMNSCNVFFYNTGRAAGVDALEFHAKLFGLNRATGIDLPDEVKGIVPGRSWKQLHKRGVWYEGETVNYAIGQGYLAVTPIEILDMMSVIANGAGPVRPWITRRVGSRDISGRKPDPIGLKNKTLQEIRNGLFAVVNDEGGTGKRAKVEGAAVAGKTGTAQNPHGRTHAWFTGYAPFDNPRICVVVFLEHGGKGGLEPAEIAQGLFAEAKARGYI